MNCFFICIYLKNILLLFFIFLCLHFKLIFLLIISLCIFYYYFIFFICSLFYWPFLSSFHLYVLFNLSFYQRYSFQSFFFFKNSNTSLCRMKCDQALSKCLAIFFNYCILLLGYLFLILN